MTTMTANPFTSLSWNDLEQWVGSTILERGKGYQRHVYDLVVTEENHLIANVTGTEQYITRVWLDDGEPVCECNCPYWDACKHAVAVILVYLDYTKSKRPVQLIKPDELDARLSVYGIADEQDINIEQARAMLKSMTKAQIIEWSMEVLTVDPSLFDTLPIKRPLPDDDLHKTVTRLRQQIRKTASERGWQNHWNNSGYIPDYSPLQKQLEKLLKGGHIEAVLELGEELFTLGITQVEESDDEGETASELSSCLGVLFEAMSKSQRSAAERMIWFWDKLLNDDFGLLDELTPPIDNTAMKKADWLKVVEEFNARLENCPKPKSNDWSSGKYHRQQLLKCTLDALSQAGENERATELMVAELPYSDNYVELVESLLTKRDYDQAEHWAYQGFNKTIGPLPGIAWKLVSQLLEIAMLRKDWLLVAALRMETFLQQTNIENYRLIKKDAQKAGCWQQIQPELLHFLETGASPLSSVDWPLPDTMLKFQKSKHRRGFPDYNALIEVALYEKRTEDALRWFQKTSDKNYHAEAIAQAVKNTHPDVSFDIWQHKVESLIAKVKPAAYREAMPYLKKMKTLMQSLKRSDDYRDYVTRLRQQHKAKRRLIEELDALDSKGKKNRPILSD